MPRRIFVKIFFGFVILVVIFSATVYFFAKPVLLFIAQKELHKIFKESSVQGIKVTLDFAEFQNIKIREKMFDVNIKKARVYYDLRSILNKEINKAEAIDVDLNFYKDDIKIKARASLQLDMPTKSIDYMKLNISSCKTNLFEIEGLILSASQGQDTGEFYIKGINYNNLKVADVMGKSELKGKSLCIKPLLISFLGGNVKGEFNITLDQDIDYNLSLDTQGMEIKRFVDDMKLNEKFNMTGRLGGAFYLSGKGQDIKDIKGDFNTDAPGGVLIIKDKTFLENVAKQSNQPLDIIVESFRNYNYNNGMIKLFMESGNIGLDLELDGSSGKRSLAVILHDFNKGKERQ
nr:YdbH domain-containing protein [Candidatus Omnitrophota bacterium]